MLPGFLTTSVPIIGFDGAAGMFVCPILKGQSPRDEKQSEKFIVVAAILFV